MASWRLSAAGALLGWAAAAAAQDAHAAIHSTRGVQHKAPLISDDMVVGAIMVMFLMLFAFGASSQRSTNSTQSASTPAYILVMQQFDAPY